MRRKWHPFWNWEDIEMWRKVTAQQERELLEKAVEFTGNAQLYGSWMMKVIEQWPIACEHNLTDQSLNQQAWVGHAAAQMAIECPEYITRKAWGMLTQDQRDAANLQADIAIYEWNQRHIEKSGQLRLPLEAAGLS